MEWINGELTFSNGRHFYANGFIGIHEQYDGKIEIAEGYDGRIHLENADGSLYNENDDENVMTQEEKGELADYMISLWTKFKSE